MIKKATLNPITKHLINLILIFQLAFYPCISQSNPAQPKGSKAVNTSAEDRDRLQRAKKFNTEQVESLREYFLSPKDNTAGLYQNHPLDIFGLLGQQTFYQSQSLRKRSEKLSKQHEELEKLKTESLNENLSEDERYARIEEYESFQENISFQSQNLAIKQMKHKINNTIRYQNILVEIVEDSDQNDKNKEVVVARLSHPEKQNLSEKLINSDNKNPVSSDFVKQDKTKKSFRLSFQGNIIQTFPQNIEWMAFFENYLIFLEAPKVTETKASLSFIDLKFFERAIGHTALAIFQIPVDLQTVNMNVKKLLSPKIHISKNKFQVTDLLNPYQDLPENRLNIETIALSKSQLDYLSSLQQMHFNTTVALLDPTSAKSSKEFLKEWIATGMENLKPIEQNSQGQQISRDLQQQALKALENRRQIGTMADISGNYGALNNLDLKLPEDSQLTPAQKKIKQNFKTALTNDKSFQESITNTHKNLFTEQNFLNRYFSYLSFLTRPQPMGSPTIKQSLALIANSVSLNGDNIENRFQTFKEALKQATYPKTNRRISIAVLAGLATVASPEVARFYLGLLDGMADGTKQLWELTSITTQASFEWISLDGIYKSYFEGDKKYNLVKGLVALSGAFLVSLGILHTGVNSADYIKTLRSQKEQEHKEKINGLFAKLKENKQNFINYVDQGRKDFITHLSRGEKVKMGIPIQLSFGQNNIQSNQLMKTTSDYADLISALQKENSSLKLTIQGEVIIELKKIESTKNLSENQISISIDEVRSVWTGKPADIKLLLDEDQIKPDLNMDMEIRGENLHIHAHLSHADFSDKENTRLNQILTEIEQDKGKDLLTSQQEAFNDYEIKTLKEALVHLMLGNSSWAKTTKSLGLSWNWFFLSRSLVVSPVTMVKMLWYKKYLNIVLTEKHIPTIFNGGKENRLDQLSSRFLSSVSFKQIKEFEGQVLALERQVLEQVSAQAYLKTLELSAQLANSKAISQKELSQIQSQSDKTLKAVDIKNKKLRMFYSIYQRELFTQVMRDILMQYMGIYSSSNDFQIKVQSLAIKVQSLAHFAEEKTALTAKPELIESLINTHSHKLAKKSLSATNNLVEGFLKRVVAWSENKSQRVLNPQLNTQMGRFATAENLLNKPEALARATRQFLAEIVVDTPIALLYQFLFLAGVDQGILLILHDQAFTEEAWFHLSRYAIWAGFFSGTMINILASTWFKVQIDSRLDASDGFDQIPNKRQAQAGYLKWVFKQFTAKDNNWWVNQKHALYLAYANFFASTVMLAILFPLTLGRFDLELFLAGYLVYVVTPLMGLNFKLLNTFEKSAGYALSPLIKRGLDLKGEDQKFRAHPTVQAINITESHRLRRKFNLWLAVLYGNPVNNMLDIFGSIDTSTGSRGLLRIFTGGLLPTEHFVNFMDFLENKQIVGSDFADKCKSVFTNNRTDL